MIDAALKEFDAQVAPLTKEQRARSALRAAGRARATDPNWSDLDAETRTHIRLQADIWGETEHDLLRQIFKAGLEVFRDEYPGFIA